MILEARQEFAHKYYLSVTNYEALHKVFFVFDVWHQDTKIFFVFVITCMHGIWMNKESSTYGSRTLVHGAAEDVTAVQ